jgi:hypothetical protein
MNAGSDMRIPVSFGAIPTERDDAWLVEDGAGLPAADLPEHGYVERFTLPVVRLGHIAGCSCCTPRGPASDALSRMFRARATGTAPFFKRVVVTASPTGEAAIRDATAGDLLTAARFRLADQL